VQVCSKFGRDWFLVCWLILLFIWFKIMVFIFGRKFSFLRIQRTTSLFAWQCNHVCKFLTSTTTNAFRFQVNKTFLNYYFPSVWNYKHEKITKCVWNITYIAYFGYLLFDPQRHKSKQTREEQPQMEELKTNKSRWIFSLTSTIDRRKANHFIKYPLYSCLD